MAESTPATKSCKFGARCHRKKCRFVHPAPPAPSSDTNGNNNNQSDQDEYDEAVVVIPASPTPAKTKKIVESTKPCRFGAACKCKAKCRFQHPPPEDIIASVVVDEEVPPLPLPVVDSPNPPNNKNLLCRFGSKCQRKKCRYVHPQDENIANRKKVLSFGSQSGNVMDDPHLTATTPKMMTVEELEKNVLSGQPPPKSPTALRVASLSASSPVAASSSSRNPSLQQTKYEEDPSANHDEDIDELLRQQEAERLLQQLSVASANAVVETITTVSSMQQHQTFVKQQQQQSHPQRVVEQKPSRQRRSKREKQQDQQQLHSGKAMEMQDQAEALVEQERREVAHLKKQLEKERQLRLQADERSLRENQKGPQIQKKKKKQLPLDPQQPQPRKEKKPKSQPQRKLKSQQGRSEELHIKNAQEQEGNPMELDENHEQATEDDQISKAIAESLKEQENHKRQPCEEEEQEKQRRKEEEDFRNAIEASMEEEKARQEEREEYKAKRNAAKKERRRREREAKETEQAVAQSLSHAIEANSKESLNPEPSKSTGVAFSGSNGASSTYQNGVGSHKVDSISSGDDVETFDDLVATKSKESKAEKKRKKHEQWLLEMEKKFAERSAFWEPEITKEIETVHKMVQLCIGELCRQNPHFNVKKIVVNQHVQDVLLAHCRASFRKLFQSELHSRVIITGMGKKQQDMNDRNGTIQYWNEALSKYEVSVDAKKGSTFSVSIPPGNLEAGSNQSDQNRKSKKGSGGGHSISIENLYDGKPLLLDLDKKLVEDLCAAHSVDGFISRFVEQQNYLEHLEKEMERQREQEEVEERRRRAERKRREEEQWQNQQRRYAEEKRRMKEEQRREEQQYHQHRGGTFFYSNGRGGMHFGFSPGAGMGYGRRRNVSGMDPFEFLFHMMHMRHMEDDDDDYENFDEDDWDRRWEAEHEEDLEAKNEEAADVLGVDLDALPDDIKRVYRRKALIYHPDKYNSNNSEGLTKEESEEKFKELQNAYDHLMSNFD